MKYKISDVSKIIDVSPNTIRRFEKMGYISPERESNNGYRTFSCYDIDKILYIEMYRKYGFFHKDINNVLSMDLQDYIEAFEFKSNEIEKQIEYLKNLNNRLKGNIKIMKKCLDTNYFYFSESRQIDYILYRTDDELLTESERVNCIHEFLYESPEAQAICIFPKEVITQNINSYYCGIGVKHSDFIKYNLRGSDLIQTYEPKPCLFFPARLRCDLDYYLTEGDFKNTIFGDAINYLTDNNLQIDGDIFGIRIALLKEENVEIQYILVCIPYSKI